MQDTLWVEKYRPRTIQECILPDELKATFQKFVDDKFVPNMILAGGPGIGKTTVAKALLDELGCDYIVFNGSLNVDKDSLRNDIARYASSMSISGGRKYIILDEADYLNAVHVQPALRNFMEEFSKNCGFILTCNFKNRLMEPLHSRNAVIDFKMKGKGVKEKLAIQFLARVTDILNKEGVPFEKKVVAEVILKHFPDFRRVLNELQRYAASGAIDSGILASVEDSDVSGLVKALKAKDFSAMRKWVGANSTADVPVLFRKIYDTAHDFLEPNSLPPLVIILADYQYKHAFVSDPEINMAACFTQIMVDCTFKE